MKSNQNKVDDAKQGETIEKAIESHLKEQNSRKRTFN